MELHYIQLQILKELLFNPNSKFTTLNSLGITSDLFAYHIKQLINLKLVKKENGKYILTSSGKDYANRIDTEEKGVKIEKQGKLGVICYIFLGSDYDSEMVVQTRLKEPFFGYKGGVTGKIKFGETIYQTAKREILEETGLKGDLKYKGLAHHINLKENEVVEDKYLFIFSMLNSKGKYIKEGQGFSNEIMTIDDFKKQNPVYEGEFDLVNIAIGASNESFIEILHDLTDF